jgi:hypothetical protein
MNGAQWLRRLTFAYFILLITEGALRKWIFPSLSGPLLIVRDPLLLLIYAIAIHRGQWQWDGWMRALLALAAACAMASIAVGCPLKITLFGLRTDFWQIPLIFLMPSILTREDVRRIGRWMVLMLPAMALLALLQFRAGPQSWLNAATGGQTGEPSQQLFAAAGRVRPSGTFSFVTGMVSFLALGTAFLIDAFLEEAAQARLWLATGTLVLALGISGSRSAIIDVGIVAAAAGLICLQDRALMRRLAAPLIAAAVAFAALHGLADFRAGLDVNKGRFDDAGGLKEGILDRWLGDFDYAWYAEKTVGWLGAGLGLGTSVGAGLATGTRQFLLAEGEWERIIKESGPVLGVAFIALRLAILRKLLRASLRALRERGDALPGLLLAAGLLDFATGQWGQATVSGFAIFTAGLCLAASGNEEVIEPVETPEPPRRIRGRGVIAQSIRGERP